MSKRNRNKKLAARPEEGLPIDVYKSTDEDILAQELAALDYVPPVFAVPALDAVLEGTDREAEQMIRIYKL